MVRVDKWLWCVRVFKSRSQATEACKKGRVKISNLAVKPAHEVKENETVFVRKEGIEFAYKVLGCPDNRVSTKLAIDYVLDITSPEEKEKIVVKKQIRRQYNEFGLGRPSKKDRRDLGRFFNNEE